MKIGIAISTHNRYEVFKKTYTEIKKYLPPNCKLVVVDDASDIPCPEATFRFETNVGINIVKNKCIELLEGCDKLLLFDDDTFPICENWWKPYIESKEPHLSYIFIRYYNGREVGDSHLLYSDSKIEAFTHPRGCMVYLNRECIDKIGGFNPKYGKWGFEHVDVSNRVFNVGLTTFRYMDVPNSDKLIYSLDEHNEVAQTYNLIERRQFLDESRHIFNASYSSKEYYDYKDKQRDTLGENNVIIAQYFTNQPDPQKRGQWEADTKLLKPLIKSINGKHKLIILNDCFKPTKGIVEYITVESLLSPYFQRWISTWQYLRDNPEIDNVWLTDVTDVEMLKDPFKNMDSERLSVGSEPDTLANRWLTVHHSIEPLVSYFRSNPTKPLLNCGLIGGSRQNVMDFLHDMIGFYCDKKGLVGEFDMGMFNYIAHFKWSDKLDYGDHINTKFKQFEVGNTKAMWRHK